MYNSVYETQLEAHQKILGGFSSRGRADRSSFGGHSVEFQCARCDTFVTRTYSYSTSFGRQHASIAHRCDHVFMTSLCCHPTVRSATS